MNLNSGHVLYRRNLSFITLLILSRRRDLAVDDTAGGLLLRLLLLELAVCGTGDFISAASQAERCFSFFQDLLTLILFPQREELSNPCIALRAPS